MPRVVLVLLAMSFIGFGLAFTLKPLEMAQVLDISLFTPTARTDFRAIYDGLEVGLGVFLLTCAFRRHLVGPGLQAGAWAFAGLASVRLVGLALEGFGQPLMIVLFIAEMVAAGLSVWALFNLPAAPYLSGTPATSSATFAGSPAAAPPTEGF